MPWGEPVNLLSTADAVDDSGLYSNSLVIPADVAGQITVAAILVGSTDDFTIAIQSSPYERTQAVSATIAAGGTGYVVGDVLTVTGVSGATAATFTVDSVSGGVVTAVSVTEAGYHSQVGANPLSTSGGTGSGCTLTVTWAGNVFDTEAVETATLTNDQAGRTKVFKVKDLRRVRVFVASASTTDSHGVDVYATLGSRWS